MITPVSTSYQIESGDFALIEGISAVANTVLTITGRAYTKDDAPVDLKDTLTLGTINTLGSTIMPMGKGRLVSLQISADDNTTAPGDCYLRVSIWHGTPPQGVRIAQLLSGYVGGGFWATWPGQQLLSSLDGNGAIVDEALTTPAAGDPMTFTSDGAHRIAIIGVTCKYTASGQAATRFPFMSLTKGTTEYLQTQTGSSLVAQDIITLSAGPALTDVNVAASDHISLPLPKILLPAASVLTISAQEIQTADTITEGQITYQRYLVP